jgi:hypothetical protein
MHQGKIQRENHIKKHGDKARKCGKRPALVSAITEKERIAIATILRRQWGRDMLTGPVKVAMLFKIPSYPDHNKYDLSNSRQIYEDLLQEQIEEQDKNTFKWVIKRVGSNIIQNDKQIQSGNGTRFWWLCQYCHCGHTGKRTKSKAHFCPGTTKCPKVGIEIRISDWVHPIPSQREIDYVFENG